MPEKVAAFPFDSGKPPAEDAVSFSTRTWGWEESML